MIDKIIITNITENRDDVNYCERNLFSSIVSSTIDGSAIALTAEALTLKTDAM